MKFQKLTITLTFVCLATIAICAVGFLPIESLLVNTADGGIYTYAEYYDSGNARGYTLSISVSADGCGASASVTPQIINVGRFNSNEDTKPWFGTAICNVQRDAYTKVVKVRWNGTNKVNRGPRTKYVAVAEANKSTDPHAFDIQAMVSITQAFVGTIKIPGGGTGTLTLQGGFDLDAINGTITYQHQGKSVTRVVVEVKRNETVRTENSYGRGESAETIDPYTPPIDCSARAERITFDGSSYSDHSETYRNGVTTWDFQ